jgi:UDP-3-O-[3-hydroxymyristoyl] N-acetylglucosamine deacetylase
MRLVPAAANHGVVFRLLPEGAEIQVEARSLINGYYATTIGRGGVQIQTVEHVLAAVRSLGIDNLVIEIDAPEPPAMDGSAAPFVALLREAGRVEQSASRHLLWIAEPIRVGDHARWIHVSPAPELCVSYTLDSDHPAVGVQVASVVVSEERFVAELAPARTYGFLKDVELLRQQGLARGGSLDNAVVLGDERVLNGTLRFQDEFVRHKILDLVGDLALVGRPVVGHVVARNAGHELNHQLVREIARRVPNWTGDEPGAVVPAPATAGQVAAAPS